jgi:uncharacterized protein (TIGR02246 family)
MRLRDRLSLGLFGVVATLTPAAVLAQPSSPPPTAASTATPAAAPAAASADATHDALRALRKRIVEAFNARNVDALLAEAHPDIVFTTMNNDVARGREGVRAYFNKMMVGPDRVVEDIKIDFEPDALTALYGDTGISAGSSDGHYKLTSGMEIDIRARWTATLVKHEGAWKVAAFHYSTNVFDNPILHRLERTAILAGAVAVVLALGLGFVLGRRRRTA